MAGSKRTTKAASKATAPAGGIGFGRAMNVDSMQNLVSGMGTEKDKMFNTFFGLGLMPREQLDAAYRGDWISRKAVDIPAYDATREWREWQADPDDVTLLETVEKDLNLQQKVMQAMQRARLYGGAALVLGVDQGQPEDEIVLDDLDVDCLSFVHVVSRFELTAGEVDWDVLSPYYGEPKYYQQNSSVSTPVKLHPSRVVRFLGAEIPDINQAQGWGDSILQAVSDAIMAAGTVSAGMAQLVAEAKIDIIKIPGLTENIINKEYEDRLKKRFGFANTVKSIYSMLLLDKEEEWERVNAAFAGMPDVLKTYLLIASGAVDIPATRFLGQSPAGLSATGDSDMRNYYDRVATEQKVVVQPKLNRLDEILIRSALGSMPSKGEGDNSDIFYNWRPLWQMTDAEKADVATKKAATAKVDADMGLINTVVLKKAREAQLIADGTYPGFEQLIEEFDDDPELENAAAEEEANAALNAPPITDPNDPDYDPTKDPASPKFLPAPPPPPLQLAPPKSKAKVAAKGAANAAVDGMVRRLQDASTPRTLYVRRDLLPSSVRAVKAWAEKAGFRTTVADMHVTIIYSKAEVDWLSIGNDSWGNSDADGNLTIKAGGPRVLEKFGKAVVLAFASTDLQWRHRQARDMGADWSYDDYTPHVTITYDAGDIDFMSIKAFDGELKLGPEIFEEIKTGFNNETDVVEDEEVVVDAKTMGLFTTTQGGGHGAPLVVGGKMKKATDLALHTIAGTHVGNVTSVVGTASGRGPTRGRFASLKASVIRFRADKGSPGGSRVTYHRTPEAALNYMMSKHKEPK